MLQIIDAIENSAKIIKITITYANGSSLYTSIY